MNLATRDIESGFQRDWSRSIRQSKGAEMQ